MSTEPASSGRIVSMDQFRGYTVAGMILVNFVGGLEAVPAVMRHHNTYFSYADSIMPSFLFAAGFSYRLSMLRRVARLGPLRAYGHAILRGLGLVLVSLMMYGFNQEFSSWKEVSPESVVEFVAKLIKANLWEVLAIIGVAQVLLLPVITASFRVRLLTIVAMMAVHVALSYAFNFQFVYGQPNWMDAHWGAAGASCWDGGMFGLLPWGAIMLAGTLAYDVVVSHSPGRAARRLLGWRPLYPDYQAGLRALIATSRPASVSPQPASAAGVQA